MTSSSENSSSWLRLLPVALVLLLLAEGVGAALSVVHLREEERRLASAATKLRHDISETARLAQETSIEVVRVQQPDALRLRVASRLAPPKGDQIIAVRPGGLPNPDRALAGTTLQLAALEPSTSVARPR